MAQVFSESQEDRKRELREQSRNAIRLQKAQWAARNKEAWSSGTAAPVKYNEDKN